jgi:hypothetical protein
MVYLMLVAVVVILVGVGIFSLSAAMLLVGRLLSCTCSLRLNTGGLPGNRHRDKKV